MKNLLGRVTFKDGRTEIELIASQDAEAVDYVVCLDYAAPMMFADNIVGRCCDCLKLLQMRPYVPKRPKKICLGCAQARAQTGFDMQ